mmetsp:Transcript_16627/g.49684  ORF Transcript_16627/g.49684 Transcript_16627/m.49684 type:complete len:81 (+) Transcript_16627:957-1199(+)
MPRASASESKDDAQGPVPGLSPAIIFGVDVQLELAQGWMTPTGRDGAATGLDLGSTGVGEPVRVAIAAFPTIMNVYLLGT